jgi:GNAT superfamily N-acetyltransferase
MIKIRDYKSSDQDFISSSFYHSLKHGNDNDGFSLDLSQFNKNFNALFRWLEKNAIIKVAYSEDYPELILGYVIYQELADNKVKLWYIYTKFSVRKQGLARLLLSFTEDYETIVFSLKSFTFNKLTKKCRDGKLSDWCKKIHDKLRFEI